jgi:hypothetical protein
LEKLEQPAAIDEIIEIVVQRAAAPGERDEDAQREQEHDDPWRTFENVGHVAPHRGLLRGIGPDALAHAKESDDVENDADAGIDPDCDRPAPGVVAMAELGHQRQG